MASLKTASYGGYKEDSSFPPASSSSASSMKVLCVKETITLGVGGGGGVWGGVRGLGGATVESQQCCFLWRGIGGIGPEEG